MRTLTRTWSARIRHNNLPASVCLALLLGVLLTLQCSSTPADAAPIRVLLLQDLSTFSLTVPPNYVIRTQPPDRLPAEAGDWRTFQLEARTKSIRIAELDSEVKELHLVPRTPDAVISAGRNLYRGNLEVKWRAGALMVVNTLDLEEYLYGVVPKEAPSQWQMDALRAQAIVARTYALYKRVRQPNGDYDLAAQYIRDQHYEGFSAEQARTTQAVNDTQGLVLTCHGALIPAYYHAESAGYTENSEYVWSSPHPCLRAVKAPMYPASPYLQWSVSLSLQGIQAALAKYGRPVGMIRGLELIDHSPTGRVTLVKIIHKSGETILRGTDFRLALGPEVLRSTRFTVQLRDGRAFFNGQGWGHGVGLCQWCSQGMAELGYDYKAILTHYYQGAKVIPYQ
jgi:stage II sporulation protein D (peptidoglycan lytic transglycosylase)